MSIKNPIKKHVYIRDEYRCRKCKSTRDLQLHHITPRRLGGCDEAYNLITLCQKCHTQWHQCEFRLSILYNLQKARDTFWLWLKGGVNVKLLLGGGRIRKNSDSTKRICRSKKAKSKKRASG